MPAAGTAEALRAKRGRSRESAAAGGAGRTGSGGGAPGAVEVKVEVKEEEKDDGSSVLLIDQALGALSAREQFARDKIDSGQPPSTERTESEVKDWAEQVQPVLVGQPAVRVGRMASIFERAGWDLLAMKLSGRQGPPDPPGLLALMGGVLAIVSEIAGRVPAVEAPSTNAGGSADDQRHRAAPISAPAPHGADPPSFEDRWRALKGALWTGDDDGPFKCLLCEVKPMPLQNWVSQRGNAGAPGHLESKGHRSKALSGRRHPHEGDAPGTPDNRRLHEQIYQLAHEMHKHQTRSRNQVTRLVDNKRELEENCAPAIQPPRQSWPLRQPQPRGGVSDGVSRAEHERHIRVLLDDKEALNKRVRGWSSLLLLLPLAG